MAEVGRDSGPNAAQAGTARSECPEIHSDGFWRSPRRKLLTLSRWTVPLLSQSHSKKRFCDIQVESLVFQFVPLLLVQPQGSSGRMPGSILFVPCLQIFRHIDVIPGASCRLNTHSFLSLFSTEANCPERLWNLFPGDFQKLPACGPGHPSLGIPAWADGLYRSLPTLPVCDLKVVSWGQFLTSVHFGFWMPALYSLGKKKWNKG